MSDHELEPQTASSAAEVDAETNEQRTERLMIAAARSLLPDASALEAVKAAFGEEHEVYGSLKEVMLLQGSGTEMDFFHFMEWLQYNGGAFGDLPPLGPWEGVEHSYPPPDDE